MRMALYDPTGVADGGLHVLREGVQRDRFAQVWAAAGHPHAVFALSPADLVRITGAPVVDVVL